MDCMKRLPCAYIVTRARGGEKVRPFSFFSRVRRREKTRGVCCGPRIKTGCNGPINGHRPPSRRSRGNENMDSMAVCFLFKSAGLRVNGVHDSKNKGFVNHIFYH